MESNLTSYYLSQEKQHHALGLIKEAEEIVGTSNSSPATDVFRTLVSTFKSNTEDFMLRTEQRQKELDTQVHVYGFCEQVCVLSWHHGIISAFSLSFLGCPLQVFLND